MQLESELLHSITQFAQEALRVVLLLDAQHQVVGLPGQDEFALCLMLPPIMGPKVQDVMRV